MSPACRTIVEHLRHALAAVEELEPQEQDIVIGAVVSDLRSRRPVAVAPLGVLPAPTAPIADPRGPR